MRFLNRRESVVKLLVQDRVIFIFANVSEVSKKLSDEVSNCGIMKYQIYPELMGQEVPTEDIPSEGYSIGSRQVRGKMYACADVGISMVLLGEPMAAIAELVEGVVQLHKYYTVLVIPDNYADTYPIEGDFIVYESILEKSLERNVPIENSNRPIDTEHYVAIEHLEAICYNNKDYTDVYNTLRFIVNPKAIYFSRVRREDPAVVRVGLRNISDAVCNKLSTRFIPRYITADESDLKVLLYGCFDSDIQYCLSALDLVEQKKEEKTCSKSLELKIETT